jgi:hypothetical protein
MISAIKRAKGRVQAQRSLAGVRVLSQCNYRANGEEIHHRRTGKPHQAVVVDAT